MSIFDAAMKYKAADTPLVILAGKEYGTGSSRDWAAKGTMLLGVKAVIAESFERIHRSNLIGMGVLPLQYKDGQNAQSLGLDGQGDLRDRRPEPRRGEGRQGHRQSGRRQTTIEFEARLRIDTPKELDYYQHGGILQYVLRQLAAARQSGLSRGRSRLSGRQAADAAGLDQHHVRRIEVSLDGGVDLVARQRLAAPRDSRRANSAS